VVADKTDDVGGREQLAVLQEAERREVTGGWRVLGRSCMEEGGE
jgi:hypothetical protein